MKVLLALSLLFLAFNCFCRPKRTSYKLTVEVYSIDKTLLKGYSIKYRDSTYVTDSSGRIQVKVPVSGYDLSIKRRKMMNAINEPFLVFEYSSHLVFLKNKWRKYVHRKSTKIQKIYLPILFRFRKHQGRNHERGARNIKF